MIRSVGLIALFLGLLTAFLAKGQSTASGKKQIKFTGEINFNGQPLPGVKLELKKDGQLVKAMRSSTSGEYELLMDVNSTDESDADYVLTLTKNRMLPKTVSINTFIENPTARSYIFTLDVDMMEQKRDDIIIDLPSADVRWSEDDRKFIFDQTHAKTIKKEKEQKATKKEVNKDSLKAVATNNKNNTNPITPNTRVEKRTGHVDIPQSSLDDDQTKQERQDSLVKLYQRGITEEVFEETTYNLTKRTVIKDGKAIIYYKKVWGWGGVFYFKEEDSVVRSISENTYNTETVGVK